MFWEVCQRIPKKNYNGASVQKYIKIGQRKKIYKIYHKIMRRSTFFIQENE